MPGRQSKSSQVATVSSRAAAFDEDLAIAADLVRAAEQFDSETDLPAVTPLQLTDAARLLIRYDPRENGAAGDIPGSIVSQLNFVLPLGHDAAAAQQSLPRSLCPRLATHPCFGPGDRHRAKQGHCRCCQRFRRRLRQRNLKRCLRRISKNVDIISKKVARTLGRSNG